MLNHNYSYGVFAVAFILGATAVQFCETLDNARLFTTIIAGVSLLSYKKNKLTKTYLLISIIGFFFGFNWVAWQATQQLLKQLPKSLEKREVLIVGQVLGLPEYKQGNVVFDFHVQELWNEDKAQLKDFTIRLSCYRCLLDIKPAQKWQFMVKLKRPHGFASWGAFNYEKYLFRHNIIARGYIRNSKLNKLTEQYDRSINFQEIHHVRYYLSNYVNNLLAIMPSGAATINALLIGDKSAMTNKQFNVLQRTGLNHLFAISGLHIGLVFILIRLLVGYLLTPMSFLFIHQPKPTIQNILALFCAFLYAALAGFAIPTQRALIMLLIYVLLRLVSRSATLLQILLMAGMLIILFDANVVMGAGFWLSFIAVLIIIVSMHSIKSNSLLSLQPRLWLGMLPLLILFFHKVSLIAPILNLVVIPIFTFLLIPALMLCLICLIGGANQLADLLFIKIAVLLEYGWQCLAWFSDLPLSQLNFPAISFGTLFLLMLIMIVFIHAIKLPARYCLLLLLPSMRVIRISNLVMEALALLCLMLGRGSPLSCKHSNM